jgi:phosphoinositide-3-kinase regulatory subunit 4
MTRNNITMNTTTNNTPGGTTIDTASTPYNPLQSLLQQPRLKNNAILIQQINLLDVHSDAITDLQLTEVPQPMLISADHAGVVKVFL